jgi:hypothetical protein
MPIVIVGKNEIYKVIIDFGDDVPIREKAYKWCDLYAKINYCPERTGEYQKVVSIPPSFGVKIWSFSAMFVTCICNLIRLKFQPQTSLTNHFRLYFTQLKALPIEDFEVKDNHGKKNNYVFFVSSLWPHQNCVEGTNLFRKVFVENCKKKGIKFEGGFLLLNNDHPQIEEFGDLIFHKRYPIQEYISKTKKSALVFNTPAVHNCHGWKLGQFLAMGKAIVSTPLQNNLPENLMHGENIHYVKDENEITETVERILQDNSYRAKLENGASKYYENFASPVSVISNIIAHLGICNLAK